MAMQIKYDPETLISKAAQILEVYSLTNHLAMLNELETKSLDPNFWQNQEKAEQVMNQLSETKTFIEKLREIDRLAKDLQAFQDLGLTQISIKNDTDLEEYQKIIDCLNNLVVNFEVYQNLTAKYDQNQAILSIHPGQGGTEAMDFAEMLSRMYLRFFEKMSWSYAIIEENRGEEAGIKEVMYEVKAKYAYGFLKYERGTHRLVRLSPFNADNLRQTSFARVEVIPMINDTAEITINENDLKWQFTRSGGAGGQNVNKVNTAVALTHLPTNITVRCREERSQVQNKQKALLILKSKLFLLEEEKKAQELKASKGQFVQPSWGTQIRNYVLHPYQLVKDTRTKFETTQTQEVLDGDILQFILEAIRQKIAA